MFCKSSNFFFASPELLDGSLLLENLGYCFALDSCDLSNDKSIEFQRQRTSAIMNTTIEKKIP